MQNHHRVFVVVTTACGLLIVAGALVRTIVSADEGILLRMGTIVTAEQDELVIRDDKKKKHTFAVPPTAETTLNRRAAEIKDLKPGYFARVSAQWSGETLVALLIEATSAEAEN